MRRLLYMSVTFAMFWATTIAGAQVIYDAEFGQDLLVNLTAEQNAVAYELALTQPEEVEVQVTYLGEAFPLRLDVLLTNGTPLMSQPIDGAGAYTLNLDTGNYWLLFVGASGTTGRMVAQLAVLPGGGDTVAQNPTPVSGPAQPGSSGGNPPPPSNNQAADQDGDIVPDNEDVCPATPGNPANAGCPLPSDGNENNAPAAPQNPTATADNLLPITPLEVTPPAATDDNTIGGRPSDVDRDNDGVPDNVDACPDEAGVATSTGAPDHGCPQGASGGFMPEPGEYTFTSVRTGCYTGSMTDIPPDQAYESFMFITPGADGNSIVVSFEGKDENIFTRSANSPQFFSLNTPLANAGNGRRTEALVFDSDPIEYYDLTIDPRDSSCYEITWYELTRVSDATTRAERAQNTQSTGNDSAANDALAGSYQVDLAQSGRGCENSEVLFADSGTSLQFTVEVAPNGTDLVVTSSNGQTVTFIPTGGNTYTADDGSLRLVITVENGTITRYAEYTLNGASCDTTKVYDVQPTGDSDDGSQPSTNGGGPTYEVNGQPISEGEWAATGELAGIGCPGAEEWNTVTANSMDLDFNTNLTFTPQGIEASQGTTTTLLEPTGEPNTFRFEETAPPPYLEIIQFDSPNSGTLSRYMNHTSCQGAFRWTITHTGN